MKNRQIKFLLVMLRVFEGLFFNWGNGCNLVVSPKALQFMWVLGICRHLMRWKKAGGDGE